MKERVGEAFASLLSGAVRLSMRGETIVEHILEVGEDRVDTGADLDGSRGETEMGKNLVGEGQGEDEGEQEEEEEEEDEEEEEEE
jgi:hypothetical protein